MEKIYEYYQSNIDAYTKRVNNLNKKMHVLGTARLILFAGMIASVWFLRDQSWQIITGSVILFLLPFIGLMVWHNYLSNKKKYSETFIKLSQNELAGLDYDFSAFDGAPDKINSEHSFSLDIDLFGNRSFFQSVNRTVTWPGRELLAEWFLMPLHSADEIRIRQKAIEELSTMTQLRQHFYVIGKIHPGQKNDKEIINSLADKTTYFASSSFWKLMVWFIPIVWVLFIPLYIFGLIPYIVPLLFLFVCMYIAYSRVKQINEIHSKVNKMENIFHTYSGLIRSIEGDSFKSGLLCEISNKFLTRNGTASDAIKKLSRMIGSLDQRGSFIGIIFNIFTLREARIAIAIENWKLNNAENTKKWFEALAQFDALSSLGGFAFNHPSYIFPELTDNYFNMKGEGLGHPLIPRDVCITNDIDIAKNPWFMIVTGANMAGKSTYLRTIGLNYLLGCIGAPVFADNLSIYPASLVTSLRTSDSLISNESYFFAELKRLKMIITRLEKGEKLFIILDEILKGTNSVDKQKGSLALIKQFISYKTCGIIATHDLILGSLEDEYPDEVKNYRFEADITNNELTFSYKLREGIAQNMNACFLMNKMGITV